MIDRDASNLCISNIVELCNIGLEDRNGEGFYDTELICSKFDMKLRDIGAHRITCDHVTMLNNSDTAIVHLSTVSKAQRAKMLLIRFLSSQQGRQIRCSVDTCLPSTAIFKRIERPARQFMESLKQQKLVRSFFVDALVNSNRMSAEAAFIRPSFGVVLGDGKRLRNVVPESVLYQDGDHIFAQISPQLDEEEHQRNQR